MYFHVLQKKYPVDFDDKLKIGDVRYDNMTYVNKHNFEIHEPDFSFEFEMVTLDCCGNI